MGDGWLRHQGRGLRPLPRILCEIVLEPFAENSRRREAPTVCCQANRKHQPHTIDVMTPLVTVTVFPSTVVKEPDAPVVMLAQPAPV
jgi:hypothetical protein